MLALPPPAPAPVLPPPPPQPQRRSRRWPWIAGGVVIALILVASGSEVVASWHTYSATTGALPGATPPPTPPFQIINTPIHRPGYPGWFHIMASDGSFSLDGPGEATLVAAPHGAWELVVGGPYPTFVIYLYGYAFPDPSSTFRYATGRLRQWGDQVGRLGEITPVSCGAAIGARAFVTNFQGSRGAAQVCAHNGLELWVAFHRIGNPLGKRGRRLGLALMDSVSMPAKDVTASP